MFIGFDYGTANCSVAVMRDHGPELLTLENNEPYLPSMLCAPTREAVSECLHRHWQVPTGSEENQQLLRRAISYNREEDIPVGGDSVLFGLQALAHYMEDPEEVYFVRSPKSFLGANGLKPQQIALFEDLVCAMMFHIKRQAENVLQAGIDQAVIGRPINFRASAAKRPTGRRRAFCSAPPNAPVSKRLNSSSSRWRQGWTSRRR